MANFFFIGMKIVVYSEGPNQILGLQSRKWQTIGIGNGLSKLEKALTNWWRLTN